jgi:hypothetical protein
MPRPATVVSFARRLFGDLGWIAVLTILFGLVLFIAFLVGWVVWALLLH